MSTRSGTSSGSAYCLFGMPELNQPSVVMHAKLAVEDMSLNDEPMISADDVLKILSTSDLLNQMDELPSLDLKDEEEMEEILPEMSDQSTPIAAVKVEPDTAPFVTIVVSHKPRGSKGKWLPISDGEGIRITKGVGKRVKLDIICNVAFDLSGLSVVLLNNESIVADGISVRKKAMLAVGHAELEIRIKEKANKLQFLADVNVGGGDRLIGRSVVFGGHDTGKFKNKNNTPGKDGSTELLPLYDSGSSALNSSDVPSQREDTVVTAASLARPRCASPSAMSAAGYSSPSYSSPSTSSPSSPSISYHASPYEQMYGSRSPDCSKKRKATDAPEGYFPVGMMSSMLAANNAASKSKTSSFAGQISATLFPAAPKPAVHKVEGDLEVDGEVCARSFAQYSDARRKTEVEDLFGALDHVMQMQAKTYVWKEDKAKAEAAAARGEEHSSPQRVIGLIAQEVRRVVPEVVQEDPKTGMLAVKYAELVPVLIEALKEHIFLYQRDRREIEEQAARLDDKSRKLDKLMAEVRQCSADLAELKSCARQRTLLQDFHCVYKFHQGRLYIYAEQLYFQSGHKNCTTTVRFDDILAIEKKGKGDVKITIQPADSPVVSTKIFTVGPRHFTARHRRSKQEFVVRVLQSVLDLFRGDLKGTLEDVVKMRYQRDSPKLSRASSSHVPKLARSRTSSDGTPSPLPDDARTRTHSQMSSSSRTCGCSSQFT